MGDVYKVWDSQRGVFLAMKVLHADLAEDKVFLRRFAREAETLSTLQHPHIVRFYGLEQEGRLTFMLMDYVEGTTLRGEIFDAPKPFTVEQVLQIVKPVCSALHYAHQMGRVHCDIKPANIMVKSNGEVLVADFGIARMMESSTTMTMAGAGTPAYMAPEQILGKNPVPQTDIYALGVVLYEMLTGGERPFTGDHAETAGSTSEKLRWEKLNMRPPSPREHNPNIPPQLEALVLKCLQKKPEDRYPDAFSLLNALSAVGNDLFVSVAIKEFQNQNIHKEESDRLAMQKVEAERREEEKVKRRTATRLNAEHELAEKVSRSAVEKEVKEEKKVAKREAKRLATQVEKNESNESVVYTKLENKKIGLRPRGLAIFCIVLGWAIGGAIISILSNVNSIIGGILGGLVVGFLTAITLRIENVINNRKNILWITLSLGIGKASVPIFLAKILKINWGITVTQNLIVIILTLYAVFGIIGGFITSITLWRERVLFNWESILAITLSWFTGILIGASIGFLIFASLGSLGNTIGYTISGLIGGSVTIWQIRQDRTRNNLHLLRLQRIALRVRSKSDELLAEISKIKGVFNVEAKPDGSVEFEFSAGQENIQPQVAKTIIESGFDLLEIFPIKTRFEESFFTIACDNV